MTEEKETWDALTKLLGKIETESERLDWPEVLDLAVDVFSEYGQGKTHEEIFLECQQFLFRLYHRLTRFTEKRPMNTVYKTRKLINHEYVPYFRVVNYDFKTFIWVKKKGYDVYTDNNMVEFPESCLSESQREHFSSMVQN